MRSSISIFLEKFSTESLRRLFTSHILDKSCAGKDGISSRKFNDILEQEINIILRKSRDKTYRFTGYKKKLIPKGENKKPRVVFIPTIRDRLTLKAIDSILKDLFPNIGSTTGRIIRGINEINQSQEFHYAVRIDIVDFFPSISHKILLKKLRRNTRCSQLLFLIGESLVSSDPKTRIDKGVPQGIPISSTLADIYLKNIDEKWRSKSNIAYFRFVDDILILCNEDPLLIFSEITADLKRLKLTVHKISEGAGKAYAGPRENPINYLGYRFENGAISVRDESIGKLKDSIIKLVAHTHHEGATPDKLAQLVWRLNLRITGCCFNGKRYGWLCYFSSITELSLLKRLDHFVSIMLQRWEIEINGIKAFSKAFFEIRYRFNSSEYIPRFDEKSISEKRDILSNYFNVRDIDQFDEESIARLFNYHIHRETELLEEDLAHRS
jgi:retron-type reverse transcriptase